MIGCNKQQGDMRERIGAGRMMGPRAVWVAMSAAMLMLVCAGRLQGAGTQTDAELVAEGLGKMQYRVYLPDNYEQSREKMPVVLYLHSAAERGDSVEAIFGGGNWKNPWIGKLIDETQHGSHQAVLVMPESGAWQVWNSMNAGDQWNVGDYTNDQQKPVSPRLQLAMRVLDKVLASYNKADKNRVYLTGPSMGGYGTWDVLARYPQKFAAAAALSGGGNLDAAAKLANKPIWIFHGSTDNLISPHNSDQLYLALRRAGGSPIYSRIEGTGHGGWDLFYTPGYYTVQSPMKQATEKGTDFYDWLFAQRLDKPLAVRPMGQFSPIVVNFGPNAHSSNKMFDATADGSTIIAYNHIEGDDLAGLSDIAGRATSITIKREGTIGPANGVKAVEAPLTGMFTRFCTSGSLYIAQPVTYTIAGLNDGKVYTLSIYSGLDGDPQASRVTEFTVTGRTTQTNKIETMNNTKKLLVFQRVQPVKGVVTLRISGVNDKPGYLTCMQITDSDAANPANTQPPANDTAGE